jgi:hypothetical protein
MTERYPATADDGRPGPLRNTSPTDQSRVTLTAFDASEWSDLFVAAAGASAALAGLLFVAVSINVERILALPGVPERALQALLQLLAVVVVSLMVLAPGQSNTALGLELLAVATPLLAGSLVLTVRGLRAGREGSGAAIRLSVVLAGTAPFAIGGISLIAESGGGLYWVLAGTALALIGAVLNAWVMLVEILR